MPGPDGNSMFCMYSPAARRSVTMVTSTCDGRTAASGHATGSYLVVDNPQTPPLRRSAIPPL